MVKFGPIGNNFTIQIFRKIKSHRGQNAFIILLLLIIIRLALIGQGILFNIELRRNDFIREDAKRLHTLNINSRILRERGIGCKMPKTEPFAKDIMKFIKDTPNITCPGNDWVNCRGSECYVVNEILKEMPRVECYYSDIIYVDDHEYYLATPVKLVDQERYKLRRSDYVKVSCYGNNIFPFNIWGPKWSGVKAGFRQVHTTVPFGRENSPNVLILGLESISHNQFLRKLPLSYKVLTQDLGAIVLNSYNILGDGTPAALFPLLTGKTELEMPDARKINKNVFLDPNWFLFHKLKQDGYHTLYFEDSPDTGTFQRRFNGFTYQPTDHYSRAFFMEANSHDYCIGDTPTYSLMINLTHTFMKGPGKRFGFTMIVDISHDDANKISTAEDDLCNFFTSLDSEGILENTLLVVMADHGSRFSKIRSTFQGKIEERLPFIAVVLPEELKQARPDAEKYLRLNANILTTPFDIHTTILDVVGLKHLSNKYKVPGSDMARGISLLEPIPATRSCVDADVLGHWCSCFKWTNVSHNNMVYKGAVNALVSYINSIVAENPKCVRRKLIFVEWVMQQSLNDQVLKFQNSVDYDGYLAEFGESISADNYYQVKVVLSPDLAVFQGTLTLTLKGKFRISERDITRINPYDDEPKCLVDTQTRLSKYCFCKP